jgi:hypothetical protein
VFIRPPYGLDSCSEEGQRTVDGPHVFTGLAVADFHHQFEIQTTGTLLQYRLPSLLAAQLGLLPPPTVKLVFLVILFSFTSFTSFLEGGGQWCYWFNL